MSDLEQSLAFRLSTPQQEQDRDPRFNERISSMRYAVGLAHILNGDHQSGLAAYCGQGRYPQNAPTTTAASPTARSSTTPMIRGSTYTPDSQYAPNDRMATSPATPTSLPSIVSSTPSSSTRPTQRHANSRAVAHLAHHGVDEQRSDAYFEEALETYPDPAALYRFRIPLLAKAGLWDPVVTDYDALIGIDAENAAEHHFQRAEAHAKLENRDRRRIGLSESLETGLRPGAGPNTPSPSSPNKAPISLTPSTRQWQRTGSEPTGRRDASTLPIAPTAHTS